MNKKNVAHKNNGYFSLKQKQKTQNHVVCKKMGRTREHHGK
jgi:hypothetical protein